MKKNFRNFVLVTIIVAIIGTAFVALLEEMFGITNVFIVATAVVLLCGLLVIVKQVIDKSAKYSARKTWER